MATLGFRESYQLLASVQARKAKEDGEQEFHAPGEKPSVNF
jgi:hypothetical protein